MTSRNVVEMLVLHQEKRELCSAPMINGSAEPIIHHNALVTRVKVMARRVRISTTKIRKINQTNKRRSMIIPTEMDNQLVHMVLVETKVEKLQPNIRKINQTNKRRSMIIP